MEGATPWCSLEGTVDVTQSFNWSLYYTVISDARYVTSENKQSNSQFNKAYSTNECRFKVAFIDDVPGPEQGLATHGLTTFFSRSSEHLSEASRPSTLR